MPRPMVRRNRSPRPAELAEAAHAGALVAAAFALPDPVQPSPTIDLGSAPAAPGMAAAPVAAQASGPPRRRDRNRRRTHR